MKNKNILISGAGIGGLVLAYWLKQAGFTPTLVEKHSDLRTEGYKLDIRGTAVEVIKRMGIHDAVFEARTQIRESIFVDASGRQIGKSDPNLCGVRMEGDLEIVRADLCRIIFESIGDVECLFGDCIASLTDGPEGVRVEFKRGGPRVFDLVVGADGLHSQVRSLCFGSEANYLKELGLYVSFFSIPNDLHLDCVEIEHHASKRFAIAYCPKSGSAKAGFAFSAKPPAGLNLRDPAQQKRFLRSSFANAGWEVPRFLAQIEESPDFYFDCIAQIQMDHWTKGRVALVGDAGYAVSPISGQGASVALVGAYVLAEELKQAKGDFSTAFPRYEERLKCFVLKNQKLARINTSWRAKISYLIGKLLPAETIRFVKKWAQKKTAKAANAIAL